ncbi:MAG: purine-nucleoside phosphorylase [Bacteroidota bacterium]
MGIHIGAKRDDISDTVLLSGDPLRAKYIADTFFSHSKCYNQVRNMLGFTGEYRGKIVSVQGTGMGQPSLGIYLHELIHEYGVKTVIRIGTCGAISPRLRLGDIVIGQGGSTDASFNKTTFNGMDFAPLPDYDLLKTAIEKSENYTPKVHVGNVFSTDLFYEESDSNRWDIWIRHNVLAVDMETALLYTKCALASVKALSILTVSDHIIKKQAYSSEKREKSFNGMAKLAMEVIFGDYG